MAEEALAGLDGTHREALNWFAERAGQQIDWPKPLNGLFLLNKAKGIHKPAAWKHALSVRQTLNSPYADSEIAQLGDGDWTYDYFQEGPDPAARDKDFTNRALMRNIEDGVPVAVVRQIRSKPGARYLVLGLASVVSWKDGYFHLRRYRAASAPPPAGEPLPMSLEDARRRIERSIVARQGAGAFRAAAIAAFGGRCAISGYDVVEGLEAAHILPYLGEHTNTLGNSLLLRADLHTLLDRGRITIDPATLIVHLAPELSATCLADLDGVKLALPEPSAAWQEALTLRAGMPDAPGASKAG
ncbi:HNH endonuclease signature motif containing protein [Sphingomonas hylomeconis]|uniref:HNH endonuclease n=1 Tax=Sphingomonas hylomeconis TaxID=1395958 RepID=A0ABV7SSZ0_9SPHN|nr:HNH endonuclease signature motif containing protein [Sphingomonas hylomeconis]